MRFAGLAVLGLFYMMVCAASPTRGAPEAAPIELKTLEAASLRSIAGWLKASGREGYVAGEVADAMGIPRLMEEEVLEAKQRGFRNNDVLRVAQISSDEARDFILFMVQRPDDQVYFYFSTLRDGLVKAFVSIPSKNVVLPIERIEAEMRFEQEVLYWGERIGAQ